LMCLNSWIELGLIKDTDLLKTVKATPAAQYDEAEDELEEDWARLKEREPVSESEWDTDEE